MPEPIAASRLRPHMGTIRVDDALPACYRNMRWAVKLSMLRQHLAARFGASDVIYHTTTRAGIWIGKGKVLAEFIYGEAA